MKMSELDAATLVSRVDGHLQAEVNGEVVLMNIDRGSYYGLDDIGSDIWQRLATPVSFATLCSELAKTYDAPIAVIEKDVKELLRTLEGEGLVRLR